MGIRELGTATALIPCSARAVLCQCLVPVLVVGWQVLAGLYALVVPACSALTTCLNSAKAAVLAPWLRTVYEPMNNFSLL